MKEISIPYVAFHIFYYCLVQNQKRAFLETSGHRGTYKVCSTQGDCTRGGREGGLWNARH